VLGVITIGTPHLGTPLPSDKIADFFTGVPTPGGQSLTLPLARTEKAPLVTVGGNIAGDLRLANALYGYGWSFNVLCTFNNECANDGAVPTRSALPVSSPANGDFSTLVSSIGQFAGYDHSQLIAGRTPPLSTDDVYKTVREAARTLVAKRGAVRTVFATVPSSAPANAPITPPLLVQVRDAKDQPVTETSFPVSISLAPHSSGATLSGSLVANTVNGIATFSDLRVDRSASGLTLVARVTGLNDAVSSPFDIGPVTSCGATALTLPVTRSGSLSAASCLVSGRQTDVYSFSILSQTGVRVTPQTSGFTPVVNIGSTTSVPVGFYWTTLPGSGKWILPPGSYSAGFGNWFGGVGGTYTMTIVPESESVSRCEPAFLITVNSTTKQNLAPGDCRDGLWYYDEFWMYSKNPCTVTLRATGFDAYLEAYDSDGNLLDSDDDSGGGTDARLSFAQCSTQHATRDGFGGVTFRATSYTAGDVGPYSISVSMGQSPPASSASSSMAGADKTSSADATASRRKDQTLRRPVKKAAPDLSTK
jgi:hypothetical protein